MLLPNILLYIKPAYWLLIFPLSNILFQFCYLLNWIGVPLRYERDDITNIMEFFHENPVISMKPRPSKKEQTAMNSAVPDNSILWGINWTFRHIFSYFFVINWNLFMNELLYYPCVLDYSWMSEPRGVINSEIQTQIRNWRRWLGLLDFLCMGLYYCCSAVLVFVLSSHAFQEGSFAGAGCSY